MAKAVVARLVLLASLPLLAVGCSPNKVSSSGGNVGSARPPGPPTPAPPPPPTGEVRPAGRGSLPSTTVVRADPVYNVVLSPAASGTRSHVHDDQLTTVTFNIGAPTDQSAVPTDQRTVNSAISAARQPLDLDVILTCTVCQTTGLQEQRITYNPATSTSDVGSFTIRPLATLTHDSLQTGELIFHVTGDGKIYDRVVVPISIDPPLGAPDLQPAVKSHGISVSATPADVKLSISASGNQTIKVSVEALDKTLHAILANIAGPDTGPWEFQANLTTTVIDHLSANGFFAMKKLMDSWTPAFDSAGHVTEANGDTLLDDYSFSELTAAEEAQFDAELSRLGSSLYRQLFLSLPNASGKRLEKMMDAIESYQPAGRPLTITIQTDYLYLPWPILRSPKRTGVADFWGFKFDVSVIPFSAWIPPRTNPLRLSNKDLTPFALYADDTDFEGVGWFALKESQRVGRLLQESAIPTLRSRDGATEYFKAHRQDIKLLLSFLHATSGFELEEDDSGHVFTKELATGPSMRFNENEILTGEELLQTLNDLNLGAEPMFTNAPIVVLNACESGAMPYSPTTNASSVENLPMVLLQMGARAVIATDAPVWKLAAAHLGDNLVTLLLRGLPGPEALRLSRLELLKHRNPMGLLYSFYGDPDATVLLTR